MQAYLRIHNVIVGARQEKSDITSYLRNAEKALSELNSLLRFECLDNKGESTGKPLENLQYCRQVVNEISNGADDIKEVIQSVAIDDTGSFTTVLNKKRASLGVEIKQGTEQIQTLSQDVAKDSSRVQELKEVVSYSDLVMEDTKASQLKSKKIEKRCLKHVKIVLVLASLGLILYKASLIYGVSL